MEHYVYVYLDPRKPFLDNSPWRLEFEPFYVGMGKNDRKNVHLNEVQRDVFKNFRNHKKNRIKSILLDNLEPIIQVVSFFEDRLSAAELEIEIIRFFGRRDMRTGILTNLTSGGDGIVGLNPEWWKSHNSYRSSIFQEKMKNDQNFRENFIEKHSGENHWSFSKPYPIESRKKISLSLQGNTPWNTGVNMKEHFKEKYDEYLKKVSSNSKKGYEKIKKGKSSRFIQTEYNLYTVDDVLVTKILGSRQFYRYCKENQIDIKDQSKWKLKKM